MAPAVQILRTSTVNTPPPASRLLPGELAVEMADPVRLWVGVPAAINATERKLVFDSTAIPTLPLSVVNGGIPAGGAINQYLAKTTAADRVVDWRPLGALGAIANNNTAVGNGALAAVGVGSSANTAVGSNALSGLTTVSGSNVAIGASAGAVVSDGLTAMTRATDSIFIGSVTRSLAQTQTSEIVIGTGATGHGSYTATIGPDSGASRITQLWCGGRDLLANGALPAGGAQYQVLGKASATDRDVAWQTVGQRPSQNTAVGNAALAARTNTSATANVAFGQFALSAGDGAGFQGNTAIGTNTLVQLTGNSLNNIALGGYAGGAFGLTGSNPLTAANACIYIGHSSRAAANDPVNEIVIGTGWPSGTGVIGRGSNTVTLGSDAITQLWCGGRDILANGALPAGGAQWQVLGKVSATARDVAWQTVGMRPNDSVVIGDDANAGNADTALGWGALYAAGASSGSNVAVGAWSLSANVNTGNNTAVGHSALGNLTAGANNTALGQAAGLTLPIGNLTSATNAIFIGYSSRSLVNGGTNEIVIGANATGRGSNTVTLGTDAITQLWCGGRDILAATAGGPFLPLAGGTLATVTGAADGLGVTVTNTSNASGITAINSSTGGSSGAINTRTTGAGYGLLAETRGSGAAIAISNWSGTGDAIFANLTGNPAATGSGLRVYALVASGVQQHAVWFYRADTTATRDKFIIRNDGSTLISHHNNASPVLEILVEDNPDFATSGAIAVRIRHNTTDHFVIAADGTVTMSAAFAASMRTALGI